MFANCKCPIQSAFQCYMIRDLVSTFKLQKIPYVEKAGLKNHFRGGAFILTLSLLSKITFTTLCANSAGGKLMIVFLIFPRK